MGTRNIDVWLFNLCLWSILKLLSDHSSDTEYANVVLTVSALEYLVEVLETYRAHVLILFPIGFGAWSLIY